MTILPPYVTPAARPFTPKTLAEWDQLLTEIANELDLTA